jgi:uroporphyrinogen decarboxylase
MNPLFQSALKGQTQPTPPIWLMRQAGRYHSHYQKLRAKHGFMELCKNPRLASQVALGPIEDFDFDVSILFSDLLFPLEALGMGLDYDAGPPRLAFSLSKDSFKQLRPWRQALPHLEFQAEAMRLTREALPKNKSLIGFVGGPWTLMGYAVEGSHTGGLPRTRAMAPELLNPFFESMVPLLEANIQLQLEAGAEVVLILDTAAGVLTPNEFSHWVLPSLKRLSSRFPNQTGYYMRDASQAHWDRLGEAEMPLAGIGFDSGISLTQALSARKSGFVQGNFDQHWMSLDDGQFEVKLQDWMGTLKALSPEQRRGWVCGLGHGCTPQTREANVRKFVATIRKELR